MSKHECGPDRLTVRVPIRVKSEANQREHHMVKARRVKGHRRAVWAILYNESVRESQKYRVTFTRIAPRKLDDDNLTSAFKACRDETAKWLGMDDAPGSGIEWCYTQTIGEPKQYAIEIIIEAA